MSCFGPWGGVGTSCVCGSDEVQIRNVRFQLEAAQTALTALKAANVPAQLQTLRERSSRLEQVCGNAALLVYHHLSMLSLSTALSLWR